MEKRFNETKSITEQEIDTLASLYLKANQVNDNKTWNDINEYFDVLGKKYDFDPKYFYVSTGGEIRKTKICYRCGGVANSSRGVKYDRFKEEMGWINRPICWSCYMKKYPHKAKKEIMK